MLFGGEGDLLDDLRPYFEFYAENIFHIGPLGHAIRLKLIHNYIAFANVAAWCEGFALAAKDGLDLSQVITIISAAGGKSGMLDLYGQATLDGDFTPLMSLANARKDVRYYARWLEEAGLPGFMADASTRPTGRRRCSGTTANPAPPSSRPMKPSLAWKPASRRTSNQRENDRKTGCWHRRHSLSRVQIDDP